MRLRTAALLAAALQAGAAAAGETYPTRLGESGLLDVPDAEVAPRGGGRLSAELALDKGRTGSPTLSPFPFALSIGLASFAEAGFALRQGGQPGDPRPAPSLFSGAAKLRLFEGTERWPALAVDGYYDRANLGGVGGARLIASTEPRARFRATAFVGLEGSSGNGASTGATVGAALSAGLLQDLEAIAEGLTGPRGANLGAALRWHITGALGLTVGANYFPGDGTLRLAAGFGIASVPTARRAPLPQQRAPAAAAAAAAAPKVPAFTDERPRFRMRIARADLPGQDAARRLPYPTPPPAVRGEARAAEPEKAPARDLVHAGDLLDTRERRLGAAERANLNRTERLAGEAQRLAARERGLVARGAGVDQRERGVGIAGEAESRFGASLEQIREEELRVQERLTEGKVPLEEATRREEAALARERTVRAEAAAAAPGPESLRSREKLVGAFQERLIAARARLDALEAHQTLEADRLDLVERQLGVREDRLAFLERRSRGAGPEPVAAAVALVVHPPRAVVAAAPGSRPRLAAGEPSPVAAAVARFRSAERPLAPAEREAVVELARAAAHEGTAVAVWARAGSPDLLEAAARRAEELRGLVAAAGPLPREQVGARVTERPAVEGIEVVVSLAGAETGLAEGEPLQAGEAGRRQVRELVASHAAGLERCLRGGEADRAVGDLLLRLSVEGSGRVVRVGVAGVGPAGLEACVGRAAASWVLPRSADGYDVEVPVSVVAGGGR